MKFLSRHLKAFFLALQFLSRLPSPGFQQVSTEDSARSTLYFIVVGGLLGALLWLVSLVLQLTSLSQGLQAGLILVAWVWLTGALHLDGLADMADAWLGAKTHREKALAIMQDSRIGTGGGVALILTLLLKWLLLVECLQNGLALALLFIPALARAGAIGLLLTTEYVREKGIGSSLVSRDTRPFLWAQIFLVAALFISLAWPLALSWLIAFLLFRQASKTLTGGMTGDTAGAMIEWLELWLLFGGLIFMVAPTSLN